MPGRDVFISYSREDRAAAKYFAQCLTDEGFSVWWDAALHSGESFDQVIERELRAASAAIVLWSPRSVKSRWVRAEATLADRMEKLVPVTIEACERPIIFELTHTNDLSDWVGDKADPRWKGLVDDVARLVGDKAAPAVAPSSPPLPQHAVRSSNQERELRAFEALSAVKVWQGSEDSQATQFTKGPESLDVFHCLEIANGSQDGQRFVISPQGLKIGRVPPADVILSDRQVSRAHCTVELDGAALKVVDLGSTNGTFVDGKRVEKTAALPVGSLLRVGTVALRHQVRSARSLSERKYAIG